LYSSVWQLLVICCLSPSLLLVVDKLKSHGESNILTENQDPLTPEFNTCGLSCIKEKIRVCGLAIPGIREDKPLYSGGETAEDIYTIVYYL
jgi:hypothetical protein